MAIRCGKGRSLYGRRVRKSIRHPPCPPIPDSPFPTDQLAADNIDYNDIKRLIKLHTTNTDAQPTPIPGKAKSTDRSFEHDLEDELRSQHQRIDLFVHSKAGEIARRLGG